ADWNMIERKQRCRCGGGCREKSTTIELAMKVRRLRHANSSIHGRGVLRVSLLVIHRVAARLYRSNYAIANISGGSTCFPSLPNGLLSFADALRHSWRSRSIRMSSGITRNLRRVIAGECRG